MMAVLTIKPSALFPSSCLWAISLHPLTVHESIWMSLKSCCCISFHHLCCSAFQALLTDQNLALQISVKLCLSHQNPTSSHLWHFHPGKISIEWQEGSKSHFPAFLWQCLLKTTQIQKDLGELVHNVQEARDWKTQQCYQLMPGEMNTNVWRSCFSYKGHWCDHF